MSHEEFQTLLRRFDTAMLVTRSGRNLRARPMAIARAEPSGRLWFLCRAESGKLEELEQAPEVDVAAQGEGRFLSITGRARAVSDRGKARELWSERQRPWFPDGPEDPSLVLIAVEPERAEYWDRSDVSGAMFTLAAAEAVATGEPLADDVGKHGKVEWNKGREA
jgi:general stress protein 26